MATFHIKQGDASPIWETILQDAQGNAISLAGATITLDMTRIGSSTKTIDGGTVTNVGTPTGTVRYPFTEADTAVPGVYRAQWNVTYSGGIPETFPNEGYDIVHIERSL